MTVSSTDDLTVQVSEARRLVDLATRRQAEVEAEIGAAHREAERALGQLQQLGAPDAEAARRLLVELEQEITAELETINRSLAEAGEGDDSGHRAGG